jgi:hypothetical protein
MAFGLSGNAPRKPNPFRAGLTQSHDLYTKNRKFVVAFRIYQFNTQQLKAVSSAPNTAAAAAAESCTVGTTSSRCEFFPPQDRPWILTIHP